VVLRVSDDGLGFDPGILRRLRRDHRHFGLASLERRLTALDGRIELASGAAGTHVSLELPDLDAHEHQNPARG
jgi:signal transduction histidine kinase